MRKIVDDILKGKIAHNNESLDFSCPQIEIFLKKDETFEGTFFINTLGEQPVQGSIFSSEIRMKCLTKEFFGTREEISYSFCSDGMEEGDILGGELTIVTDCGEYEMPFRVEIEKKVIMSSLGEIKNVFHFANLAKANWDEALRIFYSKDFKKIFSRGSDKQFYGAYKGLCVSSGNQQNMEEFLLEINKKQKIELIPDQEAVMLEDLHASAEHELKIERQGWGYTDIKVESEGDFLVVNRQRVLGEDFENTTAVLPYVIRFEMLHAGYNCGSIHLYGAHIDITIPVIVVQHGERKRAYGIRKEKKKLTVELLEYYEAFRTKRISGRIWIREAGKVVDRLRSLDEKDVVTQLFNVQLLITQERFQETAFQMEKIKRTIVTQGCPPEIECYYLYLTTLYDAKCDIDAVTAKVEQAYKENPGNWRITWLMLYLSGEYTKSPSRKWLVLKEQFKRGCTSPIIYIEAWHLLEINPTLLMKLGEFEIQVLNFAARRALLCQDVIVQLVYLAQKLKTYSERVYCILKECYESYPDKETLQAICSLLIKGNRTQTKYFDWYRMGVEQELRITRLYEYFMMALPPEAQEILPKVVLMYFSYQSELDYKKNAILYEYVFRNREEQPEIYISYCEKIERFVLDQIGKGRINKELAYLYENILTPRQINEQTAGQLATLLFAHEVTTKLKDIRYVSVVYPMSREEYRYPVSESKAMVPLFSADYQLILVDKQQNRYCAGKPYQIDKLMKRGKMTQLIAPYVKNHNGLDIFMCEGNKSFLAVSDGNAGRFRRIVQSEHLEESYKEEIRMKLIHFYYEQDYIRELDQFLEELVPDRMQTAERSEVIRFLVLRSMYDKAFSWLKRYGAWGVEAKTVMRLCSRMLSRDGFLEDEAMTYAVYYAYTNRKYDVNIIAYLALFYQGTLSQMRDIWKVAADFDVDTYDLCERMIIRMLYASSFIGERMEVFKSYVSGGAKTEVEGAFLTQCSYNYFLDNGGMDEFVFLDMLRAFERGEQFHRVCKLAMLKYVADNRGKIDLQLEKKAVKILRVFLRDLTEDHIYFPFFMKFLEELPFPEEFVDKTMIDYCTKPGSKVSIHFLIDKGTGKSSDYQIEEMKEMFDGIFVTSFILFFGERLQYYITEDADGDKQVVKRESISKSEGGNDSRDSRFGLLNDIVIGKVMQDYPTVDCMLEEYYRKELMVQNLFKLR